MQAGMHHAPGQRASNYQQTHHTEARAHHGRAPAMSSSTPRERGGGRQFPVGRRRYAPVADAGCGGCRPTTSRLLRLPSFLKPCSQLLGGGGNSKAAATTTTRRRSGGGAAAVGEHYSCASTSTTASFSSYSSSSSAATRSTGGYAASSAAYSSSDCCYYYHCHPSRVVVYGAGPTAPMQQYQDPASSSLHKQQQQEQASPARAAPSAVGHNNKKKKMRRRAAEDGVGVGVAVEKESSDPRADFRDSMVQMVLETGLCDWDGLRGMLRRLLALNAPRHHAAILTAFAEVCAQLAAAPPPPAPSCQYRRC
ncbi:uncharacterized LOC100285077 [Zea mays]|uniref:Transcription repressor n=2 Tax=Zea mays TaxID=4577 RepID=C0HES3_MAIZE|nr:uncharacterized LOC100285077 [Zea mays]ACN25526.1 unknown [Zea mays]|eukprot:NP_001159231.1 plant-specific domain TIGR01568 family protein [Zea mays]